MNYQTEIPGEKKTRLKFPLSSFHSANTNIQSYIKVSGKQIFKKKKHIVSLLKPSRAGDENHFFLFKMIIIGFMIITKKGGVKTCRDLINTLLHTYSAKHEKITKH